MNKLLKYVATPVLAAVVLLGAAAPGIASADTHETDRAPTDRVLTDRPTDRPTDRARDHRVTDARRSDSIGRVELREPHVLEARGTGYVALAGRIDVSGVAYGRSVTIEDLGGDAKIRVEARASRTNDDGTTTFYGLNGHFEIAGSHVVIKFNRVGIHFEAIGNARVDLEGQGWWQLDGGRIFRWAAL
jgi:hypothetical protein